MMSRHTRLHGDDGASLVVAMIIVVVIAVVVGVVIAQSDTSLRTTVGLRDQAGSSYNGDGAAQVAINTLRRSMFDNATGSQCFGGTDTLPLGTNFYPSTNGGGGSAVSSARVVCTAESGTGLQGSPVPISNANKPGQAILTLGTSGTETGQSYGQSNKTVTIHGAVTSDSTIDASSASLAVTGGVPIDAVGACTTHAGNTIMPACTPIASPGVTDPNYAAPAAPSSGTAATPVCPTSNNGPEVFSPGLYNVTPPSVTPVVRSNGTSGASCDKTVGWYYLKPGTYYFDFTSGSHVWTTSGTTIGGTLNVGGTSPGGGQAAPAVPNACVNPINSTSAVGVQLVFGGDSQLSFGNGSNAEFCATYSATSIPTVAYGLKSNIGTCPGATCVHGESGCVTNIAPATPRCDVVSNPTNGSQPSFFFEGFVYTPVGTINLQVTNASQPYFNFGIISRTLSLSTTGSACGTCEYISLPDNSPGYGTAAVLVDLTVYVCQGQATCTSGGRLALTARVKIDDPTGSPVANQRKMTILGWNEQRCPSTSAC